MYILAFFCGVISLNLFKSLPSLWLLLAGLVLVIVFCLWFKKRIFILLLAFLLGFSWILIRAHHVLAWSLPSQEIGKDITVSGYIASIPQSRDIRTKFIFAIPKTKIQLSWYGKHPSLKAGDKWQLQVKLKPPHGSMNPAGFDYEKYLFQHRIRATGYVRNNVDNKILSSHWYKYPLTRFRQILANKILQALPHNAFAGILVALTVGSRNGITTEQWQVFRNTGTSHLVAISGLHVGLAAGFIYLILNLIWRRSMWLMLRLPASQAAAIGALVGAFTYSLMAGFSLSTMRALTMISVFMLALLLRRNIRPWRAFLLALLAVLIIDPLATLGIGFWLSFASVATLIYSFSGRFGVNGWWWKWVRPQLVIAIGLIPILLLAFQQLADVSLLANLIAIPWVGFIVVPLTLIGGILLLLFPHLGQLLLLLAAKALMLIWFYLHWLSEQHWAVWHGGVVNVWILITTIVAALLLLAPKGFSARWLGVVWLLPLFLFKPVGPKAGEVRFTLLDVGQGLASVIQTQHHILIYDTGPKFDSFDAGKAIVVPFLLKNGIKKVDALVVSHGDNDHIGGAASVLKMLQVKKIITSVPPRFAPRPAQYCQAGQQWHWDGVNFKILSPFKYGALTGNDASCVLQITDGNNSILLTGDIEALTEHILVRKYGTKLHTTMIVAPHHGSNSSSIQSFINMVKPQYVFFPAGFLNRFHFPSPKVITRYKNINATLLNSAVSGAITLRFNNHRISSPIENRKVFSHYWNYRYLNPPQTPP